MAIKSFTSCVPGAEVYQRFEDYPTYTGNDLGMKYGPDRSVLKIYAPTASKAMIQLYNHGLEGAPLEVIPMTKGPEGTWSVELTGDHKGKFYTCSVLTDKWSDPVPDPYAKAVGVNGKRGAIIDMKDTDPAGWDKDKKPKFKQFTDAILYELHVRDLSMAPSSGIRNKGKFMGLTETGTQNDHGHSTGIDHIKALGITHIHLLPSYDYFTVDETKLDQPQFNWGYDPLNYNVPEGSYATDPFDPVVRIREFKSMVKSLHDNGLRVVMDVVYNHTFDAHSSNFEQLVPGYYYRQNEDGTFSDASACGNEIASERSMVRKMIVESVLHWVNEYHVDGFRFDLMGILDIETMNLIRAEVNKVDPSILLYGEGWAASSSPLPEDRRAVKKNTERLNDIAAFSDDLRDGIKGHWNDRKERGFVSGKAGNEESLKFGIVGATFHPHINYTLVNYSNAAWAKHPTQCVNYVSCHDDNTLWDKLEISAPEADKETRKKMHVLSQTIVLTSQGIPFLHAGTEFLRTKGGDHNSYKSPDSVNQLDWIRKSANLDVVEFMTTLIALRKRHPAFRMPTGEMVRSHLSFSEPSTPGIVQYQISGNANGDDWEEIHIIFNGNPNPVNLTVPEGKWTSVVEGIVVDESGINVYNNGKVQVDGIAALMLVR